jgi:hypothetical protein
MSSIKSCPACGHVLEAVRNPDGDVLGYFCKLVIDNACGYISVKSKAEYEYEKNGSKKES